MGPRSSRGSTGSDAESDGDGRTGWAADGLALGSGVALLLVVLAFVLVGLYFTVSTIRLASPTVSRRAEAAIWLFSIAAVLLGLNYWFLRNRHKRRNDYEDWIEETATDIDAYRTFMGCNVEPEGDVAAKRHVSPDGGDAGGATTATDDRGQRPPDREYVCLQLASAEAYLQRSKCALDRGDPGSALRLIYRANRQEVLLYPFLDGGGSEGLDQHLSATLDVAVDKTSVLKFDGAETLSPHESLTLGESHAYNTGKYLLAFARRKLPEDERKLVASYLTDSGTLKTPPGTMELYNAARVVHEWRIERVRHMQHIRRFLERTNKLLALGIFSFSAVAMVAMLFGSLHGFLPTPTGGETDAAPAVRVTWRYLLLIPLAGAVGALFSSLFPISEQFYTEVTDPKVPQPEIVEEAMVARVLVGAVSGILLYTIVRSGILEGVLDSTLTSSPTALLVVAFVGGFSERVLKRSLQDLEEQGSTTPRGDEVVAEPDAPHEHSERT